MEQDTGRVRGRDEDGAGGWLDHVLFLNSVEKSVCASDAAFVFVCGGRTQTRNKWPYQVLLSWPSVS